MFSSLCGTRIIHHIGWTQESQALVGTFNRFRERADGKDGTPAAYVYFFPRLFIWTSSDYNNTKKYYNRLKESTHLYDTIFSLPTSSVTNDHLYRKLL